MDPDTLNSCEKSQIKYLKEKKMYIFFQMQIFFTYRCQSTYESNESHYFEKIGGTIVVLGSLSKSKCEKKICGSESGKNLFLQYWWYCTGTGLGCDNQSDKTKLNSTQDRYLF
jgi:hypothetical protein